MRAIADKIKKTDMTGEMTKAKAAAIPNRINPPICRTILEIRTQNRAAHKAKGRAKSVGLSPPLAKPAIITKVKPIQLVMLFDFSFVDPLSGKLKFH